jgi:hypothetical protein
MKGRPTAAGYNKCTIELLLCTWTYYAQYTYIHTYIHDFEKVTEAYMDTV